jgi:nucleotide sugar dehydrogenase
MSQKISIAVVGSGYVGLVATACFAEIGHHVICVDNDEAKLRTLESGGVPIHEDYLPELLTRHRGQSIEFTSDLRSATKAAQAIFIAVGTPQSRTGSADLSYVDAVASEIARSIDQYKVIVEKSTVPVYTNEWIRRVVERNGVPRELFDVASNPEFLREGTAVVDFLHADRIVVGADTDRAGDLLKAIYGPSRPANTTSRPMLSPDRTAKATHRPSSSPRPKRQRSSSTHRTRFSPPRFPSSTSSQTSARPSVPTLKKWPAAWAWIAASVPSSCAPA